MRNYVLIICLIHSLLTFSNSYGDVVFNELMIDPDPAVGLANAEYIELYNRTPEPISLKGWVMYYGEKAYAFPDCSIDSAGYCVICSAAAAKLFTSEIPLVAFVSFPTLANTGKQMYLMDDKDQLVTFLDYSADWYKNDFKANGGWSLECIDVDNLSDKSSNWTSSVDLKGGTPGVENSVSKTNPDSSEPLCSRLFVLSPVQIELAFSKCMQPESLKTGLNYEIYPQSTMISSVMPMFPKYESLILHLSDSLQSGTIYTLGLSNLSDVMGFPLKDTLITFGLPEKPEPLDLSLNEVLFNPLQNGCDYVEFVNVSDKCVDLSQVWLTCKSEDGTLKEGIRLSQKTLPAVPGSYWLLSVSTDTVMSISGCARIPNAIDLPSFPSMPDARGNVVLATSSAQVIDEMSYQESMHFPLISSGEGVSLEKLNPSMPSLAKESWISASTASGYGTPGVQNSQYRDLTKKEGEGFYMEKTWITPNNDGLDDIFSISYKAEALSLANFTVYDLHGRIVRTLLQNELLASTGTIFWDGRDNGGSVVPFGRYILQIKNYTPAGRCFKKRFVLTVLF